MHAAAPSRTALTWTAGRIEQQTYHTTFTHQRCASACRFDFVFPPKGSNASIGDTAAAFVGASGQSSPIISHAWTVRYQPDSAWHRTPRRAACNAKGCWQHSRAPLIARPHARPSSKRLSVGANIFWLLEDSSIWASYSTPCHLTVPAGTGLASRLFTIPPCSSCASVLLPYVLQSGSIMSNVVAVLHEQRQ